MPCLCRKRYFLTAQRYPHQLDPAARSMTGYRPVSDLAAVTKAGRHAGIVGALSP
jgi:hypothetical protein